MGTGDDVASAWFEWLSLGCLALVLAILGWRLWDELPGARPVVALGAMVVFAAAAVFYAVGPGRAGWAVLAGTPPALLGSGGGLARGLDDTLSGQLGQTSNGIEVVLQDDRDTSLSVTIDVAGGGQATMVVSRSGRALCSGPVSQRDGVFSGTCGGTPVQVSVAERRRARVAGELVTG